MRGNKFGVAALVAAGCVVTGIAVAPLAFADTCDPAVTVCQGGDIQPGASASPDYAPPVVASDDQYPFDDDWYFNPAGGGTALQPERSGGGGAPSGGGGGGGGGGGHR